MNSDTRVYFSCLSRCARGLSCRFAAGRGDALHCALLVGAGPPDRPLRSRRIWIDILRKGHGHGYR